MTYEELKDRIRLLKQTGRFQSAHSMIQLAFILSWLMLMTHTGSYYVIYLLMGVFGLYCRQIENRGQKLIFIKENRCHLMIASVFSLALMAANYDMYAPMTESLYHSLTKHNQIAALFTLSEFKGYAFYLSLLCSPVMFLGGLYLTFYILQFISHKAAEFSWSQNKITYPAKKVFLHVLLIISAFYSVIMLLCFYPGFFCPDTLHQVAEILRGRYSNRNPFYHTVLLTPFIHTGKYIFHNMNAGAAFYNLFSIVFLSSSFAYAVTTLYQLKIQKKILHLVAVFYMFMPYNILFSFNMWKDTPFNTFVLIFTVSVFRYLKKIGSKRENIVVVLLSCLGVCLFRGNGLVLVLVSLIAFALLFGKTNKKMLIALASTLVVAYMMTYPFLGLLNVSQSDVIELCSMPVQQIARTIIENQDISKEDLALISKVADIEAVKKKYDPVLSDPLKVHLRSLKSQEYIHTHKAELILLYIRLGLKYPQSYLAAWIDQTRGYWNGGYDTVKFSYAFMPNDYGLESHVVWNKGKQAVFLYCTLYENIDLLRPFVSIGLHFWLILLVCFVGFRRKDKAVIFVAVPSLSIIFSLLLGTPVFCEFRYAYGLFCCLPFLAVAAFSSDRVSSGAALSFRNDSSIS